jgi:phosphoglycolate phosphatase
MKEYDTYIFDLDGTLLDTLKDLTDSTNFALKEMGMPEHSMDDVRKFVGNGVKKLMERAVPYDVENPQFEKAYDIFRKHYLRNSLNTTHPYPGIMDLLKRLRDKDKNLAVVSNKFYAATQELCAHFFGDYVAVAIGEREDIRKKPAPDTVLEALRQLHVSSEGAVYVGDSDVDIDTARNSGLPCISVLWGFRSREFLEKHGAMTFVDTPLQIADF